MSSLGIKINGEWLDRYGEWGNPVVTWTWPYGSWELTWSMTQTTTTSIQAAMTSQDRILVDAYIDGLPVWAGSLPIADPSASEDSTTYTAVGVAREAEEAAAVGSVNNDYPTTAVPHTAAAQAIARGVLSWRDISTLSTSSFVDPDKTADSTSDETDAINYLGALLDAWTQSENKRWSLTPMRDVIVAADPTTPEYRVEPNVTALGITSQAAVGRIFARYTKRADDPDTTDVDESIYGTATAGDGWPEKIVDYTNQGALTLEQVTNRITGIQKKYSRDVIGWKNNFTIVDGQLTALGGTPAHLGLVGARVARGLMLRLQNQHDPRRPGGYYTDAVVGQAVWNVQGNTLEVSPVDSMADTFETALQNSGATLLS